MKGRNKLDSVRQVYAEQEQALTEELARLRRERVEQQAQADDLHRMLESYKEQHKARATLSAAEALRFRRFYQRMTDAVGAQEEFVNRLTLAVNGKQQEWQESFRRRRAMELVLEKTEAEQRVEQRRRDRRSAPPRPTDHGGQSLLRRTSDQDRS